MLPSSLAPLLPHQPSITLLPSAGPIPFGIWQYFLPPVNGLAQTADPQPSLESCTLLMGRPPKATRTVPWGGRNVTPSSGPAQCLAGQHRPFGNATALCQQDTSPCPCWGGFQAPGSLLEEGCGVLGTVGGSRSHPVPIAPPQGSVAQGKGAIGGFSVETAAVGGTGEAVGKIGHGRAQRQARHVGHGHGVPCGKGQGVRVPWPQHRGPQEGSVLPASSRCSGLTLPAARIMGTLPK